MKILITGGAGFVGNRLARSFLTEYPGCKISVFDNLHRRGSELNIPWMKKSGVEFVHGDIRNVEDFDALKGPFDVLVEASAEPSVLAGVNSSPSYAVRTNLTGTVNCLEFAKGRVGSFVFLSTSRVYSIAPLRELNLDEGKTRFDLLPTTVVGLTPAGITEAFPTHLPRSLYGTTKLASELLVQEYGNLYGIKCVINRCGVIAGPGQFGKSDQGIVTYWVASHRFGLPLTYKGFGGHGKQVRDVLHPDDLFRLISLQLESIERVNGKTFNVGGGTACSVSLVELTSLCQTFSQRNILIGSDPSTNSVDVPYYASDCSLAQRTLGWKPTRTVKEIVAESALWVEENAAALEPLFAN